MSRESAGWIELIEISHDLRSKILSILNSRTEKSYRNRDAQEEFLSRLKYAIEHANCSKRSEEPVGIEAQRADKVARKAKFLLDALSDLSEDDFDLFDCTLREQRKTVKIRDDIERLLEAAEAVSTAGKLGPGPHDPSPGRIARMLIHELAQAWSLSFGQPASPESESVFPKVVDAVLTDQGYEKAGRQALRSILRPPS
ncbi:hypothetical protein [Jiella marina]|uniref:hypothetical protein n=1 Tax=Jiella sp. LLJ827 TaxID=2917712 RepID=UPI0021019258|nr:hypothetical protein [Jiella sp. LLJ827]MCQ0986486.1 hypothetical protein [Jiella sp. LLJ827]